MTVVERHGLVVGNVYRVGKAFLKLYESDDAIVDKSHKLGSYAVADQRLFFISSERMRLALMKSWSVSDDGRKMRHDAP